IANEMSIAHANPAQYSAEAGPYGPKYPTKYGMATPNAGISRMRMPTSRNGGGSGARFSGFGTAFSSFGNSTIGAVVKPPYRSKMDPSKLNYLAVVAAAASAFVIGGAWYSPALFANAWRKGAGLH